MHKVKLINKKACPGGSIHTYKDVLPVTENPSSTGIKRLNSLLLAYRKSSNKCPGIY